MEHTQSRCRALDAVPLGYVAARHIKHRDLVPHLPNWVCSIVSLLTFSMAYALFQGTYTPRSCRTAWRRVLFHHCRWRSVWASQPQSIEAVRGRQLRSLSRTWPDISGSFRSPRISGRPLFRRLPPTGALRWRLVHRSCSSANTSRCGRNARAQVRQKNCERFPIPAEHARHNNAHRPNRRGRMPFAVFLSVIGLFFDLPVGAALARVKSRR